MVVYFAYVCMINPDIRRAYYVRASNRIVFETEGNLMSLSSCGLVDQGPIVFDFVIGFQKPGTPTKDDTDLIDQANIDFADWVSRGQPLESVLKWKDD